MTPDGIVEVHGPGGERILIGLPSGPLREIFSRHGGGKRHRPFAPSELRRDLIRDHAALMRLRRLLTAHGGPDGRGTDIEAADDVVRAIRRGGLIAIALPPPPRPGAMPPPGVTPPPVVTPPPGATPPPDPAAPVPIGGMSPARRIAEMLDRAPARLSGDVRTAFMALTPKGVTEELAKALAVMAVLHLTGAGEFLDGPLLAWVWYHIGTSGFKGFYKFASALVRAAQAGDDASLDRATAEFAAGIEILGAAFLSAIVSVLASRRPGGVGGGKAPAEAEPAAAPAPPRPPAGGPPPAPPTAPVAPEGGLPEGGLPEGGLPEGGFAEEAAKTAKTASSPNARGGDRGESCKTCRREGEPVNPATGAVFSTHVDFALPGVLPLVFERVWTSTSTFSGELGHGWHHPLDMAIFPRPAVSPRDTAGWTVRLADGRLAEFGAIALGRGTPNAEERLELWSDGGRLWVTDQAGLRYDFGPRAPDGLRRLTRVRDANGHATVLRRDDNGLLLAVRTSGGQDLRIVRDTGGRIAAIEGPAPDGEGVTTLIAFEYDGDGDLVATKDAAGNGFRYEYDRHLLSRVRWPAGAAFRFVYDDPAKHRAARCVETTGENGLFHRRFAYDLAAGTTHVHDSRGATRIYEWNARGRVTGLTDGLNRRTAFAYDRDNRVVREVRPDGAERTWQFDAMGRLTAARGFDGATTEFAYAASFPGEPITANPVRVAEPGGRIHTFAYDKHGNLTEYLDPAGNRRRYLRATNGLTLAAVDQIGVSRRFDWTRDGQLARESTTRGAVVDYAYDRLGRLSAMRRAGEEAIRYRRDAVGNVVEIRRPDGGRIQYEYDAEGQVLCHRDAGGAETNWAYGGMPFPLARTGPDGAIVRYSYDTELNLTAVTNAKGETYSLSYDLAGQLVEEVGFDGRRLTFEYDDAGHAIGRTDAEGPATRFRRDAMGRLLERLYPDGTADRFAYDPSGALIEAANAHRVVRFGYGRAGELLEEHQDGHVLRHTVDARRRRTGTHLPDGRRIAIDWAPDDTFSGLSFGGRPVVAMERDIAGREVERRAGAIAVGSTYDPQGRLTRQTGVRGAAREGVLDRAYEYDLAGRLASIADPHRGACRFAHDPAGRLLEAGGDRPENFVFDPAGNLLSMGGGDMGEAIGDRPAMMGDRAFAYDARGNRIGETRGAGGGVQVQYSYGPDNQLIAVDERDRRGRRRTEFAYDALGRRVSKTHRIHGPQAANDSRRGEAALSETRTWFLWDGDVLLAEASGPAALAAPSNPLEILYLHEPGTFRPVAQVRRTRSGGDAVFHYHLDRLGTPQDVTNDNGEIAWRATLKAWGGLASVDVAEVANPLRFQGQYHDTETGLHYNRFRYYSPGEGCFVHRDPIRLAGGLNFSAYVSSPVEWVDPLGLICTGGQPLGHNAPDFVVSPNGAVYPVPKGATGPSDVVNPAGKVTGRAFTGGAGGANGQVSTMRIMDPAPPRGAAPGYPNGYIKFENAAGQGVDPYTGQTLPNAVSHFPVE